MTLWQLLWKVFNAVMKIALNVATIKANQDTEIALLRADIDLSRQILAAVLPPPPVSFTVTLESNSGESMSARKATVDFQLLDNGTAKAILSALDAAGEPTSFPSGSKAVFTSSDPSVVASTDTDGLTGLIAPASPPTLSTGVTISVVVTLPDGTVLPTATSQPIDVVAGPAATVAIALS